MKSLVVLTFVLTAICSVCTAIPFEAESSETGEVKHSNSPLKDFFTKQLFCIQQIDINERCPLYDHSIYQILTDDHSLEEFLHQVRNHGSLCHQLKGYVQCWSDVAHEVLYEDHCDSISFVKHIALGVTHVADLVSQGLHHLCDGSGTPLLDEHSHCLTSSKLWIDVHDHCFTQIDETVEIMHCAVEQLRQNEDCNHADELFIVSIYNAIMTQLTKPDCPLKHGEQEGEVETGQEGWNDDHYEPAPEEGHHHGDGSVPEGEHHHGDGSAPEGEHHHSDEYVPVDGIDDHYESAPKEEYGDDDEPVDSEYEHSSKH